MIYQLTTELYAWFCSTNILIWSLYLFMMEAVSWWCSVIMVLLEILQNSQENICARVSLLITLQASDLQLYEKRDSGTDVFLWILWNNCETNITFLKKVEAELHWLWIDVKIFYSQDPVTIFLKWKCRYWLDENEKVHKKKKKKKIKDEYENADFFHHLLPLEIKTYSSIILKCKTH